MFVAHIHIDHFLPLVIAHNFARHRRPAPKIIGGIQHLQGAGIAFGHQAFDVAGVKLAGGQFFRQKLRRIFNPTIAATPQIADVKRRCFAVQLAHRQSNATQVLKRIVGGQHAVKIRRARQHRAFGAVQLLGIQIEWCSSAITHARAPLRLVWAIRKLHAIQIQLRQFTVTFGLTLPGVGG